MLSFVKITDLVAHRMSHYFEYLEKGLVNCLTPALVDILGRGLRPPLVRSPSNVRKNRGGGIEERTTLNSQPGER